MKKVLLLLVALSLSGCAQLQADWSAITSASISPTAVIVAANAFDAVEASATNYLRLPKCGSGPIVCRSANVTALIIPAVRAGRIARNAAEGLLNTNPGALGPTGVYAVLTAATNTLKSIFTQYGIN